MLLSTMLDGFLGLRASSTYRRFICHRLQTFRIVVWKHVLLSTTHTITRRKTTKCPIGVPRVPYRNAGDGMWQWTDIWNVMYRERIIFLGQHVNEELGNQLVATMLYLDSANKKDLKLYINCPGGEVVPCLALLDTMRHIKSDVTTIGFGGCMGMAGFLLTMGQKNKRSALRNTRIMLHHPTGTARGQASCIQREAHELLKIRDYMDKLIAQQSMQPVEKVAYDLRRNLYMTTEDALEYGIIDIIVRPAKGKLHTVVTAGDMLTFER